MTVVKLRDAIINHHDGMTKYRIVFFAVTALGVWMIFSICKGWWAIEKNHKVYS